jgi:hypothetical protein
MTYKILNKNIIVKTDEKFNLFIPTDLANTDYKAYLAWVAEGNVAEEWNPGGSE